jgi:hypothetical protein
MAPWYEATFSVQPQQGQDRVVKEPIFEECLDYASFQAQSLASQKSTVEVKWVHLSTRPKSGSQSVRTSLSRFHPA